MKYILVCCILFLSITFGMSQIQKEYYENGSIKSEGKVKKYKTKGQFSVMINTVKKGQWKYYYEEGTLAKIENYKIENRNQTPIGIWKYYDADGRIIFEKNIQNNKMNQLLDTGYFKWFVDFIQIKQIAEDTLFFNEYLSQKENKGLYVISQNTFAILNTTIDKISFQSLKNVYKGLELFDFENPTAINNFLKRIPPYDPMNIDSDRNYIQNFQFNIKPYFKDKDNDYFGITPKYWYSAGGTPDYYEEINGFNKNNPTLAFRVFTSETNDIEYIQNELKKPLEKNKNYCLKFQLLLDKNSNYATTQLGAVFSNSKNTITGRSTNIPKAQIYNHKAAIYASSKEWMTWCSPYTAKGDETFVTIGSFQSIYSQKMYLIDLNKTKKEAYYYIDDVYLFEIDAEHPCSCFNPEEKMDTFQVGTSFILRNIFFETDKAILKSTSYTELDKLYLILMDYPHMKIEISGHTDNDGTDERNDILSLERAKAVLFYLVSKNIANNRLTVQGFGSKKPIDTNETAEGKQNNRRVEFKVLEK